MPRNELTNWLEGTDRRSIGRANEVAALVVREPQRFPELIGFLWSDDPVVRMRTAEERRRAAEGLQRYLGDNSSIVKTFALQGLTELAQADHSLLPEIREILETAERAGTPAMRARARKLLKTPKR